MSIEKLLEINMALVSQIMLIISSKNKLCS